MFYGCPSVQLTPLYLSFIKFGQRSQLATSSVDILVVRKTQHLVKKKGSSPIFAFVVSQFYIIFPTRITCTLSAWYWGWVGCILWLKLPVCSTVCPDKGVLKPDCLLTSCQLMGLTLYFNAHVHEESSSLLHCQFHQPPSFYPLKSKLTQSVDYS